jgi:hypothetical protein
VTQPPATQALEHDLTKLDRFATQMDALFRIPGTRLTVGVDSLLGLVPVAGDTLAMGPQLYVLLEAKRLGASPNAIGRMFFNVGLDYVIGLIPLAGDLFDLGWRANIRNVAILREDLGQEKPASLT